jgi:acetyl-CoA synthetase
MEKTDFKSYEDFRDNYHVKVPENFNFAFDVVDIMARETPDKIALVWCDDLGGEKIITFSEMKRLSDRAANFFKSLGIKKGDTVMLALKGRYEWWHSMLALHKIGAIAIPATHMLTTKDIVYRAKLADIKMIAANEKSDQIRHEARKIARAASIRQSEGKYDGWIDFNAGREKRDVLSGRPVRRPRRTKTLYPLFHFGHCGTPQDGCARLRLPPGPHPHGRILAERHRRRPPLYCG